MCCICCALQSTKHPYDDEEAVDIPLISGSVAEFYIEPTLQLFGDIDLMYYHSTELAIPQGHPPPTQLPDEFHNYVRLFEIVDSDLGLPGYVYLELRYLLTECSEDGKYNSVEYDDEKFLSHSTYGKFGRESHGPAYLIDHSRTPWLSIDKVPSVRCLSWPTQAADWPTRHRNYDWPDSATVDRVVSDGCDVVGVAHRQCRRHICDWMIEHQWRLSFSRAEIVLINSWMPVQQIVYHMLRFFVKTERLADSTDNSEAYVISNYHIKTLMMWACELKSSSFWTNDINLIRICVELLRTLSIWLADAQCLHYFINNCNLIDNLLDVEITASRLESMDEAWLSKWFVNNYIHKSYKLCSGDNVSSLFRDISTISNLQKAVSAVTISRLNTALTDTWRVLNTNEYLIPEAVNDISLTVRSYTCWMRELTKTYTGLSVYLTAVELLNIASKISTIGFTDELMDILATIAGQSICTRRHPSQCSSELSLSKATKLMKVVVNSSRSTMQRVKIELSKAYLHRALRCKDSDSDSIYCLANVYLAVLYCTTGQYQMAIDHCTLVTRSQDHSQCSSHVVQGELVPKIDDDTDNVLGLAVFYQYVRTAALNQRQTQHVSVFTTELFAHFLNIKCLLSHISLRDKVHRFINYFYNTQLFIADVLGAKLVIRNFHYQPTGLHSSQQPNRGATDLNTSELGELLQRSAVEHLTTYRQLEARDFGFVATIGTTDFEALYAYKHGDYQRCLRLSTQNVRTMLFSVPGTWKLDNFSPFSIPSLGLRMPIVPMLPTFLQLLDDDIVSLTALTMIVNPKCRKWNYNVDVCQLNLSLYLIAQCQLKLHHSMSSLVRTFDCIKFTQSTLEAYPRGSLNHLTLKLIERKLLMYLSHSTSI